MPHPCQTSDEAGPRRAKPQTHAAQNSQPWHGRMECASALFRFALGSGGRESRAPFCFTPGVLGSAASAVLFLAAAARAPLSVSLLCFGQRSWGRFVSLCFVCAPLLLRLRPVSVLFPAHPFSPARAMSRRLCPAFVSPPPRCPFVYSPRPPLLRFRLSASPARRSLCAPSSLRTRACVLLRLRPVPVSSTAPLVAPARALSFRLRPAIVSPTALP